MAGNARFIAVLATLILPPGVYKLWLFLTNAHTLFFTLGSQCHSVHRLNVSYRVKLPFSTTKGFKMPPLLSIALKLCYNLLPGFSVLLLTLSGYLWNTNKLLSTSSLWYEESIIICVGKDGAQTLGTVSKVFLCCRCLGRLLYCIRLTCVKLFGFYSPVHFWNSCIDFNMLYLTHLYKIKLYILFSSFWRW